MLVWSSGCRSLVSSCVSVSGADFCAVRWSLVVLVQSGVCLDVTEWSCVLWLGAVSSGWAALCVSCVSRLLMLILRRMMMLCLCTWWWPLLCSMVLFLAVMIRLLWVVILVSTVDLWLWNLVLFLILKTSVMSVLACVVTVLLRLMNVRFSLCVSRCLMEAPLVLAGLIRKMPCGAVGVRLVILESMRWTSVLGCLYVRYNVVDVRSCY